MAPASRGCGDDGGGSRGQGASGGGRGGRDADSQRDCESPRRRRDKSPVSAQRRRDRRDVPDASAQVGSKEEAKDDDRLISALLLRDARNQAERADEDGITAYLEGDPVAQVGRVNERLLRGEISQARSFNRRCGVEPLPTPPPWSLSTPAPLRKADALEREFVRRAHELREAAGAHPSQSDQPPKRRKEKAADECPAHRSIDWSQALAEEDDEDAAVEGAGAAGAGAGAKKASLAGAARGDAVTAVWLSKGLRVRVVDEAGAFQKFNLQKGVLRKVDLDARKGDVEVAGGDALRGVPQENLETVVSKSCKQVEVVRGKHRGLIAKLLSRDPRRNIALVGLGRAHEEAELELQLDDVCEFA